MPSEEIETAVAVASPETSPQASDDSFADERSASPVAEQTPTEDRAAFVSKVSETLRNLKLESNSDDEISGTDVPADPSGATPVVDGDAANPEETAESLDAAVKAPEKLGAETPTLPDSYIRSLKAGGWTDEKIALNLRVMGKDFIDTAATIHSSRNHEVGLWAEAGRQAREQQQQQSQRAPAQQTAMPGTGVLPLLNVEELKKEYGDDALITRVVAPMNAVIEQMNRMLPAVQETQRRANQAEQDMLFQQIDGFFGSKGMAAYKDVYGDNGAVLKEEHFTARNKVLEMADALVVGASLQHRKLSSADALQMAHDSVSSGFKKQEARAEIKQQLTKRAAGVTLKPSSRNSSKRSGGGLTHEELVKKVSAGLAAMRED